MTNQAALVTGSDFEIFAHGNKTFPKGASFIVQALGDRSTEDFLIQASIKELKSVFQAAAHPEICGEKNPNRFMVLHAIAPNSDDDYTNSSRDCFHLHVFPDGFKDTNPHILEKKSYVPHPNTEKLDQTLAILPHTQYQDQSQAQPGDFSSIVLNEEQGAEAKYHNILTHPGFRNFEDFCQNASDANWQDLRTNLLTAINATKGGVRFIFKNDFTSCFSIQALGGENLAQSGSKRWFEDPSPTL